MSLFRLARPRTVGLDPRIIIRAREEAIGAVLYPHISPHDVSGVD